MIPACPSLMCSFNRGNTEGTNSLKMCVWCLCMHVLCLWRDWFCRLTWQKGDNVCEKNLETYIRLRPECDCPEVTLCGWQDIKMSDITQHPLKSDLKTHLFSAIWLNGVLFLSSLPPHCYRNACICSECVCGGYMHVHAIVDAHIIRLMCWCVTRVVSHASLKTHL